MWCSVEMDLLIKGGKIFNSYLKKFIENDIIITEGKIYYVGDTSKLDFCYKKILEAPGKFILPGLIDIHMHIESSMATPQAFSNEIIKNGVTTIVSEPHEMANVFGIEGINEMIKNGEGAAVDIYYGVPSSVPSTSKELETTGGEIDIAEIQELLKNDKVICLGEVMNCYDVINGLDSKTNRILSYCRENHGQIPIEGHVAKVTGVGLSKVLWSGITSDHTQQTLESFKEKIMAGMFMEIQDKSLKREIVDYVAEHNLYEHIAFVTDDVMPDILVKEGHLNKLIKKAVELGMSIENAIYCSTFTPARRMNLKDRGVLASGKNADLVILDDLKGFKINSVYKNGKEVYCTSKYTVNQKMPNKFPEKFYNSIKRENISGNELKIKSHIVEGSIACRIINVKNGTTFTDEIVDKVNVKNGYLDWENSKYCMIAVFERYGKNKNIGLGLIAGDTIKRGAVAASYAHDHHNIIGIGRNMEDIVKAVNTVISSQGGYFAVENNRVLAGIELPIGGILSDMDMTSIGSKLSEVTAAMRQLGYNHYNPVMSLSTIGLPVSQLLKITDKGLIRVDKNKIVDIFVEEQNDL